MKQLFTKLTSLVMGIIAAIFVAWGVVGYIPVANAADYTFYIDVSVAKSKEAGWGTKPYAHIWDFGGSISDSYPSLVQVSGEENIWKLEVKGANTMGKVHFLSQDVYDNSNTYTKTDPSDEVLTDGHLYKLYLKNESDWWFHLEDKGEYVPSSSDTGYNQTLYVGIASANRHEIQRGSSGYEPYKFYVNEEDLNASTVGGDTMFGFRFYSEPNGGVWMGGSDETAVTLDTEYTTSGIKRFFIREVGAYVINVKSYDPVNSKVVFSISKLEGDVVLPELYIGGTWNDNGLADSTKKTRILSSKGRYQPLKVEVTSENSEFRFYSAETGGNWMGPIGQSKTIVDTSVESDGTQIAYTTDGNDNVFIFKEKGTYEINVSEYLSTQKKVTFTAKKIYTPVSAPNSLYIRTNKGWDNPVQMTYDPTLGAFTTNVEYAGGDLEFHFRQNAEDFNDMVLYPDVAGSAIVVNSPEAINKISSSGDPYKAWKYSSNVSETVKILVYFGREKPVVEVMGSSDKNYYLIGDQNEWFSKEFEPGSGSEKGINADKFNANKDKWKFEYAGDGWYKFSNFPNNLLTGEFQIVGGGSWDINVNEVYSNVITVSGSEIEANNLNNYRAFMMNRITRDNIKGGHQYRIRKRDGGAGSNIGMECNAVKDAVLLFKPGDKPCIRIQGTPVDYFIFYNMEGAVDNPDWKTDAEGNKNEYWVRARVNTGNPNSNNTFLPGIKYGSVTLPYIDINGNTGAHMNVGDGIDLAPYDLKGMTRLELENLFFGQEDIVGCIYDKKMLPNGRNINEYDKVWIAKIPTGFEDPAGTKYTMSFTKAMTEADRTSKRTITPRNYYFFPQESGIHVHINAESIKYDNVSDIEVAYRIYKTDENYNTVVVEHGSEVEGGRKTTIIRNANEELQPTAQCTGDALTTGWYTMEVKSQDLWNCDSSTAHPDSQKENWLVSWDEGKTVSEGETDLRREVPYQDNHAFVQFRIKIKLNTPIAVPGRQNAPVSEYTVYVPESADVANDKNHFALSNNDLYVDMNNNDGIWTGVNEILDDICGEYGESAAPVYYNLQGVRVDNPENGIFIKVTGSKSEKLVL